jgi:hypothetical protein
MRRIPPEKKEEAALSGYILRDIEPGRIVTMGIVMFRFRISLLLSFLLSLIVCARQVFF